MVFKFKGYLLLQLVIIISMIMGLIGVFIINYHEDCYNKFNRQLLALYKLQQLFFLAQTAAINLGEKVYLCPTINQKNCINNWNHNIMLFTETVDSAKINVFYYNNSMLLDPLLRARFFGGNQLMQKLTFLPNGMLLHNGEFCIYNHRKQRKNCLYFNQAGKVYIK